MRDLSPFSWRGPPNLSDGTQCRNVFVTGATGCVGQHLLDLLTGDEQYRIFALVRDPDKLKPSLRNHPRIVLVQATLDQDDIYRPHLEQCEFLVHMAASWGGPQTYVVNVDQSLKLMNLVHRERCRKIVYFSTSSILDSDHRPLEIAKREGTDYIRSKYACHERLRELDIHERIVTLFPSLIMAAGKDKPVSHVSSGIPKVARWAGLVRFLKADGSFHYIHAHDIALITRYLLEHDTDSKELVLGNPAITCNDFIEQFCAFFGKRVSVRIELTADLAEWIIRVFRIQMSPWDYYYIKQRHFYYKYVVNPATFGLSTPFTTLTRILAE